MKKILLVPIFFLIIHSGLNAAQVNEVKDESLVQYQIDVKSLAEKNCKEAILSAKNRLESINGVKIFEAGVEDHGYRIFPSGRSQKYYFILSNHRGSRDVMTSPVLSSSIAYSVVSSCDTLGLIEFGIYQTDWISIYGLMGKRLISFDCIDYDERSGVYIDIQKKVYRDIPWGYQRCL